MKFCAYMIICLSLPFVLPAEDVDMGEAEAATEDEVPETAAAKDPGFERYRSILERMPFGVPPPGFNPDSPNGPVAGEAQRETTAEEEEAAAAEAEASEIEQQIQSSVSVSMLNRSPDGRIFVGFTDKSVQPPKNYLLTVGEKREGCDWLVVDADPDNGQVKLSKDGVEATLKMGGGGGPVEEKGKEGEAAPKHVAARQMPGPGHRRRRLPPLANPGGPGDEEGGEKKKLSGLEIARARRQERINQRLAEEEKQRQVAELAQKEREEREREKKEREKEREQEKRERELAAEERKAQMDQLLQLRDELRQARENRAAEAEGETPSPAEEPEGNEG